MSRRTHLRKRVRAALEDRDASAFVHVGSTADPAIQYCLAERPQSESPTTGGSIPPDTHAIAIAEHEVLECQSGSGDETEDHPARRLATQLQALESDSTTLLTPRTIPHDAALFLETAGFDLASSDLLERARMVKTDGEHERIERVQAAAVAGIKRGAAVLAETTVTDDGALEYDGQALSPARLRIAIDEAIVRTGVFPSGNTSVGVGSGGSVDAGRRPAPTTDDTSLRAGEPITLAVAPRGPDGYHGGLERTLVVDGEGGWERRAHVAITHAFRSEQALLSTDDPTIDAVETDLDIETQAFGFTDGIETRAAGVGLEARERPGRGDEISIGSVVRLEVSVVGPGGGKVDLSDLIVRTENGAKWIGLEGVGRSLEPAAVCE